MDGQHPDHSGPASRFYSRGTVTEGASDPPLSLILTLLRSHLQAIILRYAPIVGPIIGSAFIIGLYMAARLVRGDLTDRMAMVNQVGGGYIKDGRL